MKKTLILFYVILCYSCINKSNDYYIDTCFIPDINKFCGAYYMDDYFYDELKISKTDTIKLILSEDKSFRVMHFPIIKKQTSEILEYINSEGIWSDNYEEVKDTPIGECHSTLRLFLNFKNKKFNNDKNNVMHEFEQIQVNKKDSSKFVLITNYYDMDSPKTSISFRKRGN